MHETITRSAAKAISWRCLGSFDTFILSWLITDKPAIAATITTVEIITKMMLYWLHERAWNNIDYGKTT